jgi:hypothetical protein
VNHWEYQIKLDGVGNVQRIKATLVCGGNHQIDRINNLATYAPTAELGHGRLGLTIAAKYALEIHQMDVSMASMGVDLEEELYLHPPQGYCRFLQSGIRCNDPRLTKASRKMVLRLRKSLHGL